MTIAFAAMLLSGLSAWKVRVAMLCHLLLREVDLPFFFVSSVQAFHHYTLYEIFGIGKNYS